MPISGFKIQIFGAVLIGLGAITALLARAIGFELDAFYVFIGIIGAVLFVYGYTASRKASEATPERNVDE